MDRDVEAVPGLERGLLQRVVERLLELEPDTIAVLIVGSYARSTAVEDSDLDVRAVTRGSPASDYRMWFEERRDAKPLHVSPGVRSLEQWLDECGAPAQWRWALGFPVLDEMRYA